LRRFVCSRMALDAQVAFCGRPACARWPVLLQQPSLASRRCVAADGNTQITAEDAPQPPAQAGSQRRSLAALAALACVGASRRQARSAPADGGSARAGKVALITGASAGIGKALASALADSGQFGTLVLAGHNEEKTRAAMAKLEATAAREKRPMDFLYLPLELSSFDSVRAAAASFQAMGLPLHVLVCNAAVMALPDRRVTVDGHEYQLEVNYLSHFLLTNLLFKQLADAGTPSDPARIISIASSAHFVRSPLAFGDVSDLDLSEVDGEPHAYYPWTAYGQSKLAQVMFTYELDRRLRERSAPVVAYAVDPGFVDTELQRNLPTQAPAPLVKIFAKTPERGAETPILLATDREATSSSGTYWADKKPALSLGRGSSPLPASKDLAVEGSTSYDERAWSALWKESSRLVGLRAGESI